MGISKRQAAVRAIRGQMWSPGRPSTARREDRVRFWGAIARGVSSEDAAAEIGVAFAVGTRWFRQAGGMRPSALGSALSGKYLSFAEREEIAIWHAQNLGVREIARRLGRDPSTISESCGAMPPLALATLSTWPRQRSGTRSGALAGRRSRSWRPTRYSASTCRTVSPEASPDRTENRFRAPTSGGSVVATDADRIAVGRSRGVRSRSRTG